METAELRRKFASSPVARLSTVRPDGGPHVVPIVFALVGDTVFSAVDAKPKRSTALQRLANVRADLLRRLGRDAEAARAYEAALALAGNETERAFLERRLTSLR